MSEKERTDQRFVDALQAHRGGMYRVAYTMLRTSHDAEDAVSQATMKAYMNLRSLKDWQKVRPWLIRITINACHTTLRRRKRESLFGEVKEVEQPAPQGNPLWVYLDMLPENQRVVVALRYGEGMSLEEIAAALHMPKGSVSSRLSRARKLLAEKLREEEP